jgi:hypothetical protein
MLETLFCNQATVRKLCQTDVHAGFFLSYSMPSSMLFLELAIFLARQPS